jgi:hypothetical protein
MSVFILNHISILLLSSRLAEAFCTRCKGAMVHASKHARTLIESTGDEDINKLSHKDIADMTLNLSSPPQVVETGASDLADVLLHGEFNVNAKVSNDMHWLDGVTADHECHISKGQLLSCTNPHELRLQHI